MRHSNAAIGGRLRLTFYLLTRAEKLSLRDHYGGQLGGFLAFDIPEALLIGVAATSTISRPGYRWRYAGSPTVTDVPIDGDSGPLNRHNVSVELVQVPPEPVVMAGARLACTPILAGGAAVLPAALMAEAIFGGGESEGTVFAATAALEGGEPSRPAVLLAVAVLEGGSPAKPTAFAVAPVLAGGGVV